MRGYLVPASDRQVVMPRTADGPWGASGGGKDAEHGSWDTRRRTRRRTATVALVTLICLAFAAVAPAAADSRLRGEVTFQNGDPYQGQADVVDIDNGSVVATVTTASDGTWGPKDYPPGNYTVEVDDPNWQVFSTQVQLQSAETEKIETTIDRGEGDVTVQVADDDGDSVGGVAVAIEDAGDGSDIASGQTAADGSFGPETVVPGDYTAQVTESGWVTTSADTVSLSAGGSATIDVTAVEDVVTLEGTVEGPDGKTAEDAAVTVSNASGTVYTTQTDLTGSWGPIELAPGDYTVGVTKQGYAGDERSVSLSRGATEEIDGTLRDPLTVDVVGSNAPVRVGSTLTVRAAVQRNALSQATTDVQLVVGGIVRETRPITPSGGDRTTVALSWETGDGDAGNYTATVRADDGTRIAQDNASVAVAEQPPFTVAITGTDAPAVANGSVNVTVEVTNPADSTATERLSLRRDGDALDGTDAAIPGGETRSYTLTWTDAAVGDHALTVAVDDDEATTNVTVDSPDEVDGGEDGNATNASDGGDDDGGSPLPGFGAVVAAVALSLAAAAGASHRSD